MSDIANHIKELRKEKGLSQEQLAQMLHVTRQTVSAWERDRAQPSLDTLRQIAGALQVEEERLLYGGKGGRRPRYRKVSFWPMLGILPLWYVGIVFLQGALDALWGVQGDAGSLLGGQIFWGLVLMFCYCRLKDEICNQAFYRAADEDRERREQGGATGRGAGPLTARPHPALPLSLGNTIYLYLPVFVILQDSAGMSLFERVPRQMATPWVAIFRNGVQPIELYGIPRRLAIFPRRSAGRSGRSRPPGPTGR